MKRIHVPDLPWVEWASPTGLFRAASKELSIALGAVAEVPLGAGGHPFDLELGKLPPGKSGCPFHSHSAQWELFIILEGCGVVRHGPERREVRAGDAVIHPPGSPHQLINTGETDLLYYLIASNPPTEFWHYPDANKWGLRGSKGTFRREPVTYWDDDPQPTPPAGAPGTTPPAPAPSRARFARLGELPWEFRGSPKGTYGSWFRDLSLALGGIRDVGTWAGGHPFDFQTRRVPAGASVCPFHRHTVQWELFIVESGTATVRSDDGEHAVGPGDVFLQPPGCAHRIAATGGGEFVFHVIADNALADSTYYPDSAKWQLKPQRRVFRMVEVDYYDGEE